MYLPVFFFTFFPPYKRYTLTARIWLKTLATWDPIPHMSYLLLLLNGPMKYFKECGRFVCNLYALYEYHFVIPKHIWHNHVLTVNIIKPVELYKGIFSCNVVFQPFKLSTCPVLAFVNSKSGDNKVCPFNDRTSLNLHCCVYRESGSWENLSIGWILFKCLIWPLLDLNQGKRNERGREKDVDLVHLLIAWLLSKINSAISWTICSMQLLVSVYALCISMFIDRGISRRLLLLLQACNVYLVCLFFSVCSCFKDSISFVCWFSEETEALAGCSQRLTNYTYTQRLLSEL